MIEGRRPAIGLLIGLMAGATGCLDLFARPSAKPDVVADAAVADDARAVDRGWAPDVA